MLSRYVGSLLAASLLLGACSGASYNQGGDFDGVPGDDTSGGGEGGDEGGADDTAGSGTGDDGDDSGDGPTLCSNAWHPIHESGWEKSFDVSYRGNAGTGTEIGKGGENDLYVYQDTVSVTTTLGEDGWDVNVTAACDPQGEEGMFVVSYAGVAHYSLGDWGFDITIPSDIEATLTPQRQYLPPEYALGATGSWEYSYALTILSEADTGNTTLEYTVSGAYAEVGFQDITLFDGSTVEAYKLTNTYAQTQTGDLGDTTVNGYVEQFWVKGLGLVRENHVDSDSGEEILSRELTGYTGLTVAE